MTTRRALTEDLRRTLAAHADAGNAAPMQSYMKSSMPFYGIKTPERRCLLRDVCRRHPITTTAALARTMRELWRHATHREERYCAAELASTGSNARLSSFTLLPVFEQFIVDGAWWDYCDDISGNAIARLLDEYPSRMKPLLRRWSRGRDIWLRRAAILCQRRLKAGLDATLLYDCIMPSIDSDEFFLRKGIGWALRERAYAAPAEVRAFCREYGDRLSPLTVREALKRIGP
jgi:3-methyladenine DNA glycosylase AlkD